jgi:hypothetical protein
MESNNNLLLPGRRMWMPPVKNVVREDFEAGWHLRISGAAVEEEPEGVASAAWSPAVILSAHRDAQVIFTRVPEGYGLASRVEEGQIGGVPRDRDEARFSFANISELLRPFELGALRPGPTFVGPAASGVQRLRKRNTEGRFNELADRWRSETVLEASITRKAMHWAYQQIIAMGPDAVPWILGALEVDSGAWLWALAAIAGEDVAEGAETVDAAVEAWLEWGRSGGYR